MPWKILPAEIATLAGLAVCLLLKYFFDLEWYSLDSSSFVFAYGHYLGPLVPIFMLSAFGAISGRAITNMKNQSVDLIFLFRMAVVFSVVVPLHFMIKLWAPLLNRNNFDALYWSIDHNHPLIFGAISYALRGCHTVFP